MRTRIFNQIREIESLSEQVLYQKVPYGTRYQDLEMPDSIDVFVSGGGKPKDVAWRRERWECSCVCQPHNDDAVLEKTDSEENGEKEDTEGKDAGEDSKDKSEGEEGLEKAESGSGEQGDSGKDGNSAENGDSQDENANPGNGESDGKGEDSDSGENGSDERAKIQILGRRNPMKKMIPVRQISVLRVEMQIWMKMSRRMRRPRKRLAKRKVSGEK